MGSSRRDPVFRDTKWTHPSSGASEDVSMTKNMLDGGQVIVDYLIRERVPYVFGLCGHGNIQLNRGAFQELYRHYQADFPSTVRAYCKRVFQPTRGEMVPLAIRQAWKTMVTGRPGPVVLDVPFDVFKEAAAEETPRPEEWNANISCRAGADPEGVTKAVDMLLAAERPVILVGQGVKYGGAD